MKTESWMQHNHERNFHGTYKETHNRKPVRCEDISLMKLCEPEEYGGV